MEWYFTIGQLMVVHVFQKYSTSCYNSETNKVDRLVAGMVSCHPEEMYFTFMLMAKLQTSHSESSFFIFVHTR